MLKQTCLLAIVVFAGIATSQAAAPAGTLSLAAVKSESVRQTGQLVAPWLPETATDAR